MEVSRAVGGARRSKLSAELARYGQAARHHARSAGLAPAVVAGSKLVAAHVGHPLTVTRRGGRTFPAFGTALAYETTRYNNSWLNERTVEVPVAEHVLEQRRPGSVLEVGNVLRHYRLPVLERLEHTVVDKYEQVDDVVNEDARTYRAGRTFEAVVSLSTLEHVGYDDQEQDPDGPIQALETMRAHLADDGILLVTVPLGYNPALDAAVADGRFACPEQFCLRRTTKDNQWVQDEVAPCVGLPYGSPFPNANAVYVGVQRGRAAAEPR